MSRMIAATRHKLANQRARLVAEEQKIRADGEALDAVIKAMDKLLDKAPVKIVVPIAAPKSATTVTRLKTGKPRGKRSPMTGPIVAEISKAPNGELTVAALARMFNRSETDIQKILTTAELDGLVARDADVFFVQTPEPVAAE